MVTDCEAEVRRLERQLAGARKELADHIYRKREARRILEAKIAELERRLDPPLTPQAIDVGDYA